MSELEMEVGLLGPIKVWSAGSERYAGPPRQREVLAVLALHRGREMSVGQITAAVWGARAPSSAENLVHTYVGRLRRALAGVRGDPGSGTPLRSHRPGYELVLDPAGLDVARFEERARRAQAAFARADLPAARAALQEGLAEWRGPALYEACGPLAEAERARLEEMHREMAEELVYARLVMGDHHGLVPDLRRMTVEDPLRERLWALLLVALDRASRRAEALHAYDEARKALVSRLGVEPGPELQALHRDLLRAVPAVVSPAARPYPGWTPIGAPTSS
ncbi:AfsR/SARP family transcriptional regulator [Catenuloplanes atrovinosus]|uniref:DNA-binding SARP family transcriptional activator n=1 Tax=Catenuloplanes atrovinosus TaxID=137266 RepID=A0AAE3YJZ9_9ACTN|nr:AfsR/SARP family transcriptional regulator [Catenuloplanes atrovinosus]MDR7274880.1 DNA-binding SARP family transcriptional activator [Catenuloplanes atrovinosus]